MLAIFAFVPEVAILFVSGICSVIRTLRRAFHRMTRINVIVRIKKQSQIHADIVANDAPSQPFRFFFFFTKCFLFSPLRPVPPASLLDQNEFPPCSSLFFPSICKIFKKQMLRIIPYFCSCYYTAATPDDILVLVAVLVVVEVLTVIASILFLRCVVLCRECFVSLLSLLSLSLWSKSRK